MIQGPKIYLAHCKHGMLMEWTCGSLFGARAIVPEQKIVFSYTLHPIISGGLITTYKKTKIY